MITVREFSEPGSTSSLFVYTRANVETNLRYGVIRRTLPGEEISHKVNVIKCGVIELCVLEQWWMGTQASFPYRDSKTRRGGGGGEGRKHR